MLVDRRICHRNTVQPQHHLPTPPASSGPWLPAHLRPSSTGERARGQVQYPGVCGSIPEYECSDPAAGSVDGCPGFVRE